MSGDRLLLDTNVVLQILGSEKIFSCLQGKKIFMSFITELELFSYTDMNSKEEENISFFIQKSKIIDVTKDIKLKTIFLRKKFRLKLPDAIICATALCKDLILVSNDKQLKKINDVQVINLEEV